MGAGALTGLKKKDIVRRLQLRIFKRPADAKE